MRTLLIALALGVVLSFGATSSMAADHGQISPAMLAQMGLGGMQPMSDAEGTQVRGKGPNGGFGGLTIYLHNVNIAVSAPGSIAIAGARDVNINIGGSKCAPQNGCTTPKNGCATQKPCVKQPVCRPTCRTKSV